MGYAELEPEMSTNEMKEKGEDGDPVEEGQKPISFSQKLRKWRKSMSTRWKDLKDFASWLEEDTNNKRSSDWTELSSIEAQEPASADGEWSDPTDASQSLESSGNSRILPVFGGRQVDGKVAAIGLLIGVAVFVFIFLAFLCKWTYSKWKEWRHIDGEVLREKSPATKYV